MTNAAGWLWPLLMGCTAIVGGAIIEELLERWRARRKKG